MQATAAVSLVVCTRNRAAALEAMLATIQAADVSNANGELVIVDNGSTDHTDRVARAHAADVSYPVAVVQAPLAGLSRARNVGIDAARGSLIAFTDDDCRLGEDYLARVVKAFSEEGLGYAGGRILHANSSDARYGGDERAERVDLPPRSFVAPGQIQGASMTFRREVIDRVGRFDEELGAGEKWRCEDVDYCQRASYAGFLGAHLPELVVWHAHGRDDGAVEQHALDDAYARGGFYAKFLLRGRPRHAAAIVRAAVSPTHPARRAELKGAVAYLAAHVPRSRRHARQPS